MLGVENPLTPDMRVSKLSNISKSDPVHLTSGLEMTAGETTVSDGNWTVTGRVESRTGSDMIDEEEAHGEEATVAAGVVAEAAATERAENESTIRGEVMTIPDHFLHITFTYTCVNKGVLRNGFNGW